MENITLYYFSNKKYFKEIKNTNRDINHVYIDTYLWNKSNTPSKIINNFKDKYIVWDKIFILSLWKVSIFNNLENISIALEKLQALYQIDRGAIIWSFTKVVKNFNKKIPTLDKIIQYWLDPIYYKIITKETDFTNLNYPLVIKADWLTWWCWMKLINNKQEWINTFLEFTGKWLTEIFISDFFEGSEVSFSIFRLWENFIRLPISFREKSDHKLTHPDEKIKITWFIWGFWDEFSKIEKMMKIEWIYWAFYLEWIYNLGKINFLEWWTRLSWSTPIRLASMTDYNIFDQIINYIKQKNIVQPSNYSPSVQYWHYINPHSSINEQSLLQNCLSFKVEDTSILPFSTKFKKRIRINFSSDNLTELIKKSEIISQEILWFNFSNRLQKFIFELLSSFWTHRECSPITRILKNVENSHFYFSNNFNQNHLVTAVFWLIINKKQEVLFIDNSPVRWLWLPWWHIEKWESPIDTLIREIKEESNLSISWFELLWYNKIINNDNQKYPQPISYILYYIKEEITIDKNINLKWNFINYKNLSNIKSNSIDLIQFILQYKVWKIKK
jgi:ADP-ribose pyrophosphatase YjhB (NUDIX family)